MDELVRHDAVGLSRLIREGEITPIELLEITIQRIEKVNPKINAIIHKLYDQARTVAANLSLGTKDTKTKDVITSYSIHYTKLYEAISFTSFHNS